MSCFVFFSFLSRTRTASGIIIPTTTTTAPTAYDAVVGATSAMRLLFNSPLSAACFFRRLSKKTPAIQHTIDLDMFCAFVRFVGNDAVIAQIKSSEYRLAVQCWHSCHLWLLCTCAVGFRYTCTRMTAVWHQCLLNSHFEPHNCRTYPCVVAIATKFLSRCTICRACTRIQMHPRSLPFSMILIRFFTLIDSSLLFLHVNTIANGCQRRVAFVHAPFLVIVFHKRFCAQMHA